MPTSASRLRIVVLGYLVRGPIGGMAWHHLNYVLGLTKLGHDVLFLEDSDEYASCYDPSRHVVDVDPQYGLAFTRKAFDRLGLGEHWAYYDWHTSTWHGLAEQRVREFCRDAELLLNVSGVNPLREWTAEIQRLAFIDTDPVFTQIGNITDPKKRARAEEHNRFFTFGELVAAGKSTAPADGFPWQPTRQPVVLEAWPASAGCPKGRLTTIMQWESYPEVRHQGITLGMKSKSFAEYSALPIQADVECELALGGTFAPREELRAKGWRIVDPLEVTRDPWTYQRYIQASKAELAVAKHGYVAARSGWFSERSACYLATGRPAIVEDTGFSTLLPTGLGLLPFCDLFSAMQAVDDLRGRYDEHCRHARDIASEFFDSRRVLPSLIERAMAE